MNKKKIGLKENLKPRGKTMAQPDIMHDFGELGKWSESTLKANFATKYEYEELICTNPLIEKTYLEKRTEYTNNTNSLGEKRYFRPKLYDLYRDFKQLDFLKKNHVKLCSNYEKYGKIMIDIRDK